jgi:hypothetical protein
MTRYTSPLARFADLADLSVLLLRDQSKSFSGLEFFGAAELDFWGPNGTNDMDPVVTGSSLEWLPRPDRFANRLLSLTI